MATRKRKKGNEYRTYNFFASENRKWPSFSLHPDLLYGLKKIAKEERKSVSWLIETALSEYFGVAVMLRKLKGKPKPAYRMRDNFKVIKRRA